MRTKKQINPVSMNDKDDVDNHFLILHNDNHNSFEHVINSLVKYCEHDNYQAEQCAFITHYNGKCDIKKGNIKQLSPLYNQLLQIGLTVSID